MGKPIPVDGVSPISKLIASDLRKADLFNDIKRVRSVPDWNDVLIMGIEARQARPYDL